MKMTLQELARLVGGAVKGDGDTEIKGASTIRDAQAGDITLADDEKLLATLAQCDAAAVVISSEFPEIDRPSITVDDVHAAFAKIVSHFRPPRTSTFRGISPAAHVDPSATMGQRVTVHPRAVIGAEVQLGDDVTIHAGVVVMDGCQIGDQVTLFPNVTLYENTVIGDRCKVHAGAVLGAYGFGYDTQDGQHQLSCQLGNVEIANDVEIGAGATIDRGTYGPTTIGEGTKIDNLVMIAHNCRIGKHNLLCSQVGIAGSCSTGDYVVMAGQVGIGDHVHIGDQAILGAKAGVMSDIPASVAYVGIPATPLREQLHKQAALTKLPEMRKQLKTLVKKFESLENGKPRQQKTDAA